MSWMGVSCVTGTIKKSWTSLMLGITCEHLLKELFTVDELL
jgi:hypothetical protein